MYISCIWSSISLAFLTQYAGAYYTDYEYDFNFNDTLLPNTMTKAKVSQNSGPALTWFTVYEINRNGTGISYKACNPTQSNGQFTVQYEAWGRWK